MSARLTAAREGEMRHCIPCNAWDEADEDALWNELDAVREELETEKSCRRVDDERVEELIQKLAACKAELNVLRADTDPASVVGAASRDREEA